MLWCRRRRAQVFSWDTGSNLAEVIPHAKKNITCDFKPSRPFKLVFGGEDFNLSLYAGPPFRYEKGLKEHSNFVNCVRYSPDGSRFISVSSDKKALVSCTCVCVLCVCYLFTQW